MRVMIVSNIFPPHVRGGYELGLLEVARAFSRAGHDVEVITSTVVGSQRRARPAGDLVVREVFGPVMAYEADLAERLESSPVWRHYRTEALGGILSDNIIELFAELHDVDLRLAQSRTNRRSRRCLAGFNLQLY